jgi:hypothetical protein
MAGRNPCGSEEAATEEEQVAIWALAVAVAIKASEKKALQLIIVCLLRLWLEYRILNEHGGSHAAGEVVRIR